MHAVILTLAIILAVFVVGAGVDALITIVESIINDGWEDH